MSKYQKSSSRILGRKKYKTNRRLFVPRKTFVFFALTLFIFGGIFYFSLLSDHFKIKDVEILGIETIAKNQILNEADKIFEQKKLGFLSAQNYFLFSGDELQASLQEQFPKIASLEVKKINPDVLKIKVKERDSFGIWCQGSACFYFDEEGVIFEKAPMSIGSIMLSIYDEREIEERLGGAVLSNEQIVFFRDTSNIVAGNFNFGIKKHLISADGEFEFLTSENWSALLDKNESPQYQLSNLKYVLDEEIGVRINELEYVDLRLGNRVYYKYKNY